MCLICHIFVLPEFVVLTMVMFDRPTLRRTAQKCLLNARMDAGRKLSETRYVVVMQAYASLLQNSVSSVCWLVR